MASYFPDEKPAWLLWQSACIETTGEKINISGKQSLISPCHREASSRGKRIDDASAARDRDTSIRDLSIPANFEALCPEAKVPMLKEEPCASETVSAFPNTGERQNFLRQAQESMSSVEAGVQCYGSFRALLDAPYFPTSADIVLKWSAVFAPGRTVGMYVSHIAKECQL